MQAKSGKDGKGYLIEMPTELLLKALPIMKIGLYAMKLALATQGLGGIIPNLEEYLPDIDIDIISDVIEGVEDMSEAIEATENLSKIPDAMEQVYKLVAKSELGDA